MFKPTRKSHKPAVKHTPWLRRVNNMLSLVVLLLALYIIFLPLLPGVQFWFGQRTHHYPQLVQQNIPGTPAPKEVIPAQNTLVIPSLGMSEVVHEGPNMWTLRLGVWHRPQTSTPGKGSNTVLVGHRFTYTEPEGVFYNLDKVSVGDELILYWNGKKYTYRVDDTIVVPPTAVEVEAATAKPRLTLYTCTPLWSATNRLVIQASLEEQS